MSLKVSTNNKHHRQTFNITCWHKKLILYTIIGLHYTLISREPVVLRWFTSIRLTIHPPLPPRLPLRLVYTQKYLNVFECTQPYFVLLQETLNFFSLLSRGGLGPPGPPLATPLQPSGSRCPSILQSLTRIGATSRPCGTKNLIFGPWVKTIPAVCRFAASWR